MISYRLRGLINLHVVATAILATSYFLVAAVGVRFVPFLELSPDVDLLIYSVPIVVGMLVSGRFWVSGGGRFHQISWGDAVAVTSRQILVVALLMFTLIVATKDRSISRLFLASYLATCWVLLTWVNRHLPGYLTRLAFPEIHQIPAIFVGPTRALGKLESWIKQKAHLGVRVVGILSDEPVTGPLASSMTHLGGIDQLARIIEERSIGQVILLELPAEQEQVRQLIETCQAAGCRLLIYQNLWDRLPVPMAPIVENEHLFLTVHDEPLEDPLNRGIKRVFDMVVSLPVVLLILPPLYIMVWTVQRGQAPGPLLFKRPRGGQHRREFVMLKFRSMYVGDADPKREARQASNGDPRIYPFGRFLRKTSLDEFPQFWNVFVGNMSIVGPRPHLPIHDYEFSLLAKTYRTRHLVKPGITGLAQVRGFRGEISDPELLRQRVQLDIRYITTWSVWLDAEITLSTFRQIFFPPRTAR